MKLNTLIVHCALLCLVSCGPEVGPQHFTYVHGEVSEALENQQFHQVSTLVNQGLAFAQNGSDSATLYYQAHYAHMQIDQQVDAGIALRMAIHCNHDPKREASYLSALSHLYFLLGNYENAYHAGIRSLQIAPRDIEPSTLNNYLLMNTLKAAVKSGHYQEAEDLKNKVDLKVLSDFNRAAFHNWSTNILYLQGMYSEAIEIGEGFLSEALIDRFPEAKFWIHNNLGAAYLSTNQPDKASHHLALARKWNPKHPFPLINQLRLAKNLQSEDIPVISNTIIGLPKSTLSPSQYPLISEAYRALIQWNIKNNLPTEDLEQAAAAFDTYSNEQVITATRELANTLSTIENAEAKNKQMVTYRAQLAHLHSRQQLWLLSLSLVGMALVLLASWGWRWRKRHQRIKNAPPAIPEEIRQAVYELEKSVSILGTPTSGLSRRK